jgi:hypothetical protein
MRQASFECGPPGTTLVRFSSDGHTLFAVSVRGTALFWRAPSWEEIEAAERQPKGP